MKHIAFDLGGSGGKMAVGERKNDVMVFQEGYRFPNRQLSLRGSLYWNIFSIYENLEKGIQAAYHEAGACASVGIDSFCNDFGFVDSRGALVSQVHCYRDPRAERNQNYLYSRISKARLHQLTGNQNALFNTVMQLAALRAEGTNGYFASGNRLLLVPDLLGYWLTGAMRTEYCNASVTQMFSPYTKSWVPEILDALGMSAELFPQMIRPGTVLGPVSETILEKLKIPKLDVVAVCSHDTASAVAALPTEDGGAAFISSGTWSLVGMEIPEPFTNPKTYEHNFAVEGCAEDGSRILKNVMGLWLVQECRQSFAEAGMDYTYAQLAQLAEAETPFRSLIDPDEACFYMPGDMPQKIARVCRRTGQPEPERPGQFVRCVLESLALKYRWVLEQLSLITGRTVETVHILGGGGKNMLLNRFTADACGRPVLVGPVEAALCGNLLLQMMAYGEISSLSEGRQLMARSFRPLRFEPENQRAWDIQYQRMLNLFNIEGTTTKEERS